jgi:excisionase family DNA binding protein
MSDLKKYLGDVMTVKELADYLKINEKTVRENYLQFNGVRIGRHYRFFTQEVANALEKRQKQIYSADQEERSAAGEGLSDVEGSEGVGSQDEKAVRRRVERQDKHGLLVD